MTCGQCVYFDSIPMPIRQGADKVPAGYCRRYPPTPRSHTESVLPVVVERFWCGEYKVAS